MKHYVTKTKMINPFQKSYYKYKIIITFSVITILLVALLSKVSYNFIKEFYLEQLADNVTKTTQLTAMQIDNSYLSFVQPGAVTKTTKQYFNTFFNKQELKTIYSEAFIFDNNFNIIVHSDSTKLLGLPEARLLINENEIFKLKANTSTTSLPFKGNDNNWYLWGFNRLTNNYWLAVRENAENFEQVDRLAIIIWYFGLGGIALSILLGFIVAKSITQPIRKLVSFSNEIGQGNLNKKMPTKMKGELKTLTNAMDLMRNNIASNQKEKEKILAQIAHEIRNPLGGIELLTNLIDEQTDDKNKEYTKRILDEISGLKELITSYLNFSRPTQSLPEEINLNKIVEESLSLFEKETSEKNISIKKDFQINSFYFDKTHLRNILLNLIKNSIESIKENGKIIISTYNKNKNSYISIADSGSGIRKNELEKIFEPFFTTKTNGTGLGLASCKKFCEENDASIKVENLSMGSQFTISKTID